MPVTDEQRANQVDGASDYKVRAPFKLFLSLQATFTMTYFWPMRGFLDGGNLGNHLSSSFSKWPTARSEQRKPCQ